MGSLHGNPPIPIAIDTGSDSGLWIPAALAERLDLIDFGIDNEVSYGRAFGGKTVYRNIAPHALSFDNLTIRNVPITIEVQSQTPARIPFALLGQKVLRRFRVEIDYANSRISFK
jgi:predicted aspartyl protease